MKKKNWESPKKGCGGDLLLNCAMVSISRRRKTKRGKGREKTKLRGGKAKGRRRQIGG